MRHGTLTVVTPIRPGMQPALEVALARAQSIRAALFADVPGLHFARWTVVDFSASKSGTGGRDVRLLFGADYTVPEAVTDEAWLHDFVTRMVALRHAGGEAARCFDDIYGTCQNYPAQGLERMDAVEDYLLFHRVPYQARHVDFAYRVTTPGQLRETVDLLHAVDRYLDENMLPRRFGQRLEARQDLVEMHRALRAVALSIAPHLLDPERRRAWSTARASAAIDTLTYPFYRYLWALPMVQGLKLAQKLFHPKQPPVAASPIRPELTPVSDVMVQAPMVVVTRVNRGALGLLLARVALRSVNRRLQRYVVGLNHIQAIHCARWMIVSGDGPDAPSDLVFFSNYDDSWEAYIDSFLDHADVRGFLELIWSQTEGFPTAGGVPLRVASFKSWLRSREVPTRVWYSAALDSGPRLRCSVPHLHNALKLWRVLARERVDRPLLDFAARRDLRAFLTRGACPTEKPVMRPGPLVVHSTSALSTAARGGLARIRSHLRAKPQPRSWTARP